MKLVCRYFTINFKVVQQEITWQCCCCCWKFDIDKADNFKFCIFVVDTLILPLCPNKVVWWALKVMAELPNLCSQDGAATNFEEARFLTLKRESESGDCKKWERWQPESWRCKGSLWFMVNFRLQIFEGLYDENILSLKIPRAQKKPYFPKKNIRFCSLPLHTEETIFLLSVGNDIQKKQSYVKFGTNRYGSTPVHTISPAQKLDKIWLKYLGLSN